MNPIEGAFGRTASLQGGVRGDGKSRDAGSENFADTLRSLYRNVDRQIQEADRMTEELAMGKRQDLHDVMIASQKAELSFRFLLQIRNKLMDAYQEMMRMQF